MTLSLPPDLDDATGAEKLIYLTIREAESPVTQQEIREETGYATWTVSKAVNELLDRDLVEKQPLSSDGRSAEYSTTPTNHN